jgi:hypothetical protein
MVFDLFELFMNEMAILSSMLRRSKCGALSLYYIDIVGCIHEHSMNHIFILVILFLKYVMKCEPQGTIKLDDVSVRSLGLVDATPLQLQLISTTIIAKLVSIVEATLSCLQIPIISKSVGVKYVDSKPPNLCTKMVTKIQDTWISSH